MGIVATAPVPAHCRIAGATTIDIPRINRLSVVDAARLLDVTPFAAWTRLGAQMRTRDDIHAVAGSLPPMTAAGRARHLAWCAGVAASTVAELADRFGIRHATATAVHALFAGVTR